MTRSETGPDRYRILFRPIRGKKKIYIDPQETEGLYLYPSEIKKSHLEEGMELSRSQLEDLRLAYVLPRAKRRAAAILTRADKTEAALREKLAASLYDRKSIDEAVETMAGKGFVDDTRYALDYIRTKKGRKSYRIIAAELAGKGVPRETIDLAFDQVGDQQPEDLVPAMAKYQRKYPDPDYERKQKILAHFLRKGYSRSLVFQAYKDVFGEKA